MRSELTAALRDAVTSSRSPGAAVYAGGVGDTFFEAVYGYRQLIPERRPAEPDTVYDLASLTKVVATTTAIMLLREDGLVGLDDPVSDHVPIPAFSKMTVRHLMTHTAGLVGWMPVFQDATSVDEVLQRVAESGIQRPPGVRHVYSDFGFMILGKIAEIRGQDALNRFCERRIFQPLGMNDTRFLPPPEWATRCAATEDCQWRKRVIVGEVHDENAYAVGGVSGHAGLFSTASDLAIFSRALLSGRILPLRAVDEMVRFGQTPVWPWQGLGWQVDPWSGNALGSLRSRRAFGHTGWTGTSMWLDAASGMFIIQLGNTCHPSRTRRDNGIYRRVWHAAVNKVFYPHTANTHTGLDRIVREDYTAIDGKRLALLTHHAAVDCLGRSILDVMRTAGADLRYLYSPEHGIRGQAEAGEAVASERGVKAPVISLYGDRKRPSAAELREVDLFIADMQDVGARYYTYMATLKDCMEACGEAGTPMLVLDRPNPIGGAALEGPIARNVGSPVCSARIPARHGMTMGELALYFNQHELTGRKPQLSVSTLDSWEPNLHFHQCSLPWIPPSPNIPTPETALVYAGTCLFEGVNVNEGRGTEEPFQLLGAPWLDPEAILRRLSPEDFRGCTIEPAEYTPRVMPGRASSPRYVNQVCRGVRLKVDEPGEVRSFRLAVALLAAIQEVYPNRLEWTRMFDLLAGSDELRQAIAGGKSAADIIAGYEPELRAFGQRRPRLYAV